jgi:hypothetical protein
MRRSAVLAVLLAVLALTGCGSSAKTASPRTTPETTSVSVLSSPTYEKAGPNPSKSAKMVCEKEARDDIAATLRIKETSVTAPTWVRARHLYSCTYVYPKGRITLNVKELVSEKTTTAYFESVKRKFGTIHELIGLGQGAWILKNDNVLVRKDYKVLLVDTHALPTTFGLSMTRSDVGTNVAVAIMSCWTGE